MKPFDGPPSKQLSTASIEEVNTSTAAPYANPVTSSTV